MKSPVTQSTFVKLGSIAIHVEELLEQPQIQAAVLACHGCAASFDVAAIRTLLDDYEVITVLKDLRLHGLMPEKRSQPNPPP